MRANLPHTQSFLASATERHCNGSSLLFRSLSPHALRDLKHLRIQQLRWLPEQSAGRLRTSQGFWQVSRLVFVVKVALHLSHQSGQACPSHDELLRDYQEA